MNKEINRLIGAQTIQVLAGIALKAGQSVMDVYQDSSARDFIQKHDGSPMTRADMLSNQIIVDALASFAPEIPVLSEESPWTGGSAATYWAVDPLDGTKEFLKRNGEFTVNIALVIDGVARMGVICAPALKTLWAGVVESKNISTASPSAETFNSWARRARFDSFDGLSVADLDWSAIGVECKPGGKEDRLRLLGSRSHGGDELPDWLCRVVKDATLIEKGSSLKFCLIAQGDADIYIRMGPTSIWDTAAGHAILVAAGGCVVNIDRRELLYQSPQTVLNPRFIAYSPQVIEL